MNAKRDVLAFTIRCWGGPKKQSAYNIYLSTQGGHETGLRKIIVAGV